MKQWTKRILLGLSGFLFMYLVGAFYNVSFDLSQWEDASRGMIAIFGTTITVVITLFIEDEFLNK